MFFLSCSSVDGDPEEAREYELGRVHGAVQREQVPERHELPIRRRADHHPAGQTRQRTRTLTAPGPDTPTNAGESSGDSLGASVSGRRIKYCETLDISCFIKCFYHASTGTTVSWTWSSVPFCVNPRRNVQTEQLLPLCKSIRTTEKRNFQHIPRPYRTGVFPDLCLLISICFTCSLSLVTFKPRVAMKRETRLPDGQTEHSRVS